MFLYLFRIAAIVMYILGGYFNNYVLSVCGQISNAIPKRRVEWTTDVGPRPPDSNRGGAAVDGLLELQSEFDWFISGAVTAIDTRSVPECLGKGPCRTEILEPGGLRTVCLPVAS